MSEDTLLATLVVCYLAGSSITLMTIDAPDGVSTPSGIANAVWRRVILWPLYWAYLLVKMGFMLAHEVRR